MKLRSRIMIITLLIILFVQGLSCFLEIGFLTNNLEESNLRKYRIAGSQMMRKINTSLIFGKSLAHIDHDRLLSGIAPRDADNLYIIDPDGNILYSSKKGTDVTDLGIFDSIFNQKTPEAHRIFFPLSDRNEIKGNLVIVVSRREAKAKRFILVKKSVIHILVILALSLPLLYALLTVFINRPYNRFIKDIENWLSQGDYGKLKENHIDLSPLAQTESTLKQIRSAEWLSPENAPVYDQIDGRTAAQSLENLETRLYNKIKAIMQVN